ncbi:hypothetical protein K469DRAFT_694987 [Zopfia rhizophila CBS 207.26]|uniref:Uncharacterized protein n=1 Tax=Zopfia rhizophila CBS 207.26 TaxID=1314779 RepID=A0A6A6DIV2_9PEZI|nr:hypothetical protein K469DRAFT_694987 [Zopfia rhizophila CBS 207.26]
MSNRANHFPHATNWHRRTQGYQGPFVIVHVTQDNREFTVPVEELRKDSKWGETALQTYDVKGSVVVLPNVSSRIFGFYSLWLRHMSFFPYRDISQSGNGLATAAWFLGEHLVAPYFQDAIMNEITQLLRIDQQLPMTLITELYTRSNGTMNPIKQLFIDFYVWGQITHHGQKEPLLVRNGVFIPNPTAYPASFLEDVKEQIVKLNQRRDVNIDFSGGTWAFLRDHAGGRYRCRYHLHDNVSSGRGHKDALCFNLIV